MPLQKMKFLQLSPAPWSSSEGFWVFLWPFVSVPPKRTSLKCLNMLASIFPLAEVVLWHKVWQLFVLADGVVHVVNGHKIIPPSANTSCFWTRGPAQPLTLQHFTGWQWELAMNWSVRQVTAVALLHLNFSTCWLQDRSFFATPPYVNVRPHFFLCACCDGVWKMSSSESQAILGLLEWTFLSRQMEHWAKVKLHDSVLQPATTFLPWHRAEVTQGRDYFLQRKSKKFFQEGLKYLQPEKSLRNTIYGACLDRRGISGMYFYLLNVHVSFYDHSLRIIP